MLTLLKLFLPILFPSWRFFEAIGPSPRIEVRLASSPDWHPLGALPARLNVGDYLRRLVHAPEWNAQLYLTSTAIRHAVEPTAHTQSTLTRLIARDLSPAEPFAFRIAFLARDGQVIGKFIEYESPLIDPERV